jgi:ribosomal protein S18 acetylase RimI-like enzyme
MLSYLKGLDSRQKFLGIMHIENIGSVKRPLSPDITINPLTSKDVEYVGALQPEGWGNILTSIHFYCTASFCYPLKATLDDKIVGIGTAIFHGSTAWLAHIIVHKDYRNAGIGSAITDSLISLVRKASCETILLIATPLGEPVYKKLGFDVETQYIFFDHGSLPEPAGESNVVPFREEYRDALIKFDHRASGEYRQELFTPFLAGSKIFLKGNEIKGFYIPTLGEGLIISSDPQAGIEMMKHRGQLNKLFCIPKDNKYGIQFLERNGYKKLREGSRMILGKKIRWNASQIYNRIGGNLG